jgi:hypothetical protein
MSLKLLLMKLRVAMVSSTTTPKLGKTREMSGLKHCGHAEMKCTIEKEKIRRIRLPLPHHLDRH